MLHLNEQESTKQTTGDGIEQTGFIRSFYHGSSYYQFKLLVNTLQIYTNHFDGIPIEKLEFESSQAHVHNLGMENLSVNWTVTPFSFQYSMHIS